MNTAPRRVVHVEVTQEYDFPFCELQGFLDGGQSLSIEPFSLRLIYIDNSSLEPFQLEPKRSYAWPELLASPVAGVYVAADHVAHLCCGGSVI